MPQIFSPQKYREKTSRFKFNWKKIGKYLGYLILTGFLFVAGIFLFFYKDLPSPGKLNDRVVAESTKILDRSGEHVLYEVHGEEKRTQIPFSEMPDTIRYATIALEDNEFYSHHGIKLSSIIRAVFKDVLKGGRAQGGSTITQQLIKHSMLSSEKTFTRKIKEAILAIELEQKFEKDEILAMYLNEIPYGSNAYGIEAASQTFFGIHAKELNLAQSALLASLPQAPSYYSPHGSHPEDLKYRQEHALKRMAELGYITPEQAEEAKDVDILSQISPHMENISAPHFVMYIKEYLEKKYGQEAVEQGGLRVYTTLDWDKQMMAEKAVREGAEKNKKYNTENAALVAMDPKTGQILAMVGSKDYFDTTIDGQVNVAIRDRQPGSSFKPFVYLTAFQKGYTPETMLWDVDTNFSTDDGKEYNPKNYDGKNRGPLQMKDALAMSLNVPAVKTLYLAGVKNVLENVHKMGIATLNDPDRYGLSLVLGGGEVKLLEHVNAFSTLATGGVYHKKVAVLKIEDNKGTVLEKYEAKEGEKVIEEKHIAMLDYILSTNELRAPVFGDNNPLKFDNRPVAAKTGTTNEWRDGWTMGFTPSLAVGVWAGNNDNSPMAQGADGVYVAAPIWRNFMDQALKNYSVENFPKYEKEETGKDILDGKFSGKDELEVCEIPDEDDEYCLANDSCPDDTKDKKKFTQTHCILYYVDKDDPRGEKPSDPGKDLQYNNWEKAVRNYIKEHKKEFSDSDAPTEECKPEDFGDDNKDLDIKTTVSTPSDGATITSSPFTISASAVSGYKIKKMVITVDGEEVKTSNDSSISYSYSVPDDKKTSSINIVVSATDKKNKKDNDKLTVTMDIP
ncbi:MAG TPA: penicillin-binding protein [Candidatus Moranbacteria bacterium]|nr:penicillin-binding protein [Candidatus Moranbacteria bacterium]